MAFVPPAGPAPPLSAPETQVPRPRVGPWGELGRTAAQGVSGSPRSPTCLACSRGAPDGLPGRVRAGHCSGGWRGQHQHRHHSTLLWALRCRGSHYLTGSPFLSWTLSRYKALSQVSEITRTVTAATTERARPGPKHFYAVISREPSPPRRWELSLPRTGKDSQGQGERTLVQATPGGIATPPVLALPSEPHRIGALFPPE